MVHPESINFGNLHSGFENEERFFTIINTGTADLHLFEPQLFDDSNRFFAYELQEITIEPGDFYDIFVVYEPQTYELNNATIEIVSNDEETPLVVVSLEGLGDAPLCR